MRGKMGLFLFVWLSAWVLPACPPPNTVDASLHFDNLSENAFDPFLGDAPKTAVLGEGPEFVYNLYGIAPPEPSLEIAVDVTADAITITLTNTSEVIAQLAAFEITLENFHLGGKSVSIARFTEESDDFPATASEGLEFTATTEGVSFHFPQTALPLLNSHTAQYSIEFQP